jgi:hypothetical protein
VLNKLSLLLLLLLLLLLNNERRGIEHVWGEDRCIQGFVVGNLRERDHLENLGVDGMIILK